MDIEDILKTLGLEELTEVFSQNAIDYETALLLGDQDLKELIPKIGLRLKFKNYLETQTSHAATCDEIAFQENKIGETNKNVVTLSFQESGTKVDTESNSTTLADSFEISGRESLDGRAILKEGKGGLLTESSRRKLCQLLIHHILEHSCSKKISSTEFYKLATEIVEIFHKESVVVYYSAYSSATSRLAKKNASGKLYESYITRRRKLRESGDLPGTSRSSSVSSPRSTATFTDEDINISEIDHLLYEETLLWLKNNVDPWKAVEDKWQETADHRLKRIQFGLGEIADYFRDFPALKHAQGYTLLLSDFNHLYPGKENNLYSSITLKKEDIVEYAKSKLQKIRDKDVKSKIADFINLINEDEPETLTNVALILLAYIINLSPARKQKGKPTWKPSRAEVCDGYISHAACEADVTSKLITKREHLQELGRTLQPFVIVVGPSVVDVKTVYVVINDTLYRFTKLVTAVDCAFKVFQSTGASYPEEAADIWLFIQLGFYNIKTKFDRPTQAVNTLLTDLQLVI